MHEFHPHEFARAHLVGAEFRDAAGELRSVQIANPHHVAGGEAAFAPRHAGRQQAFARFPQRLLRAAVNKQKWPPAAAAAVRPS